VDAAGVKGKAERFAGLEEDGAAGEAVLRVAGELGV